MSNLTDWLAHTANLEELPAEVWKKRAWRAMRPVVERYVAALARPDLSTPPLNAGTFMRDIDEAGLAAQISPSGKRWGQEREVLRKAIDGELFPEPTDEDRAAVLVAIDLVELGQYAEAIALLVEQAPRRLNRRCPACNATRGIACMEIGLVGAKSDAEREAIRSAGQHWMTRIIPHESRIA